MKLLRYGVGTALLLALLNLPITLFAQDAEPINVIGSQPAIDVLEALVEAGELDISINSSATGTTSGFGALCQGETDIALASRPMSVEEEADCVANQIEYAEYLMGYDILAIITHADLASVTCLADANLNTVFAPSAQDRIADWDQIEVIGVESLPLSVYLPPDTTTTYALLDRQVSGFGFRADAIIETDDAAVISAVGNTPGAIGVVRLSEINSLSDVHIIELHNADLGECFAPSADTVDNRQYTSADRLFAYVNQTSMDKAGLDILLTYVTGEDSSAVITEFGFVAPSAAALGLNQAILQGTEGTGRQFSKDLVAFQIPPNIFGQINVAGSAGLSEYLQNVVQQFSTLYSSVTVNLQLAGETAGLRRLCNNEIDFLAVAHELSDDQLLNCEANNISTAAIGLGKRATVLLANANDSFLECVTVDQVIDIWGNTPEGALTRWNEVGDDFPDSEILLVSPTANDSFTDLLLTPDNGPVIPARLDAAESNPDPLYRSAAVANVEGSMTYMSWQDYQNVLETAPDNIQLVAVNAGAGCITPSDSSILSDEYPYTENYSLVINQSTLIATEKQSFLWYLFSDENYSQFEESMIIGPHYGMLPDIRDDLQTLFAEALTLPPPMLEATPESTPEATPDSGQ